MKKTVFFLMLLLALILGGCAAADEPETTVPAAAEQPATEAPTQPAETAPAAPDYDHLYDELLASFRRLLEGGWDQTWEPPYILLDLAAQYGAEAVSRVGYSIGDLSGDGIPELVVGPAGETDDFYQGMVYALYTLEGEIPVLVADSAYRNAWYFMGDSLLNIGSNGAAYSIYGIFDLTADGRELVCRDYYFTHEVNGDLNNIGCFHNTTGEWGEEAGELLDISLDDFWAEMDALRAQTFLPEMTPFSAVTGLGDWIGPESTGLICDWAENVLPYYSQWDTVVLTEGEYSVQIAFLGSGLKEVELLQLTLTDQGFKEETVYFCGELQENVPLVVHLTFYGDAPSWGISYVDQQGERHRKGLTTSGYDGSLILTDYEGSAGF